MADADRCISCGAIIPEGRMVCPRCENEIRTQPARSTHYCPSDCKWHGNIMCLTCRRNRVLVDHYEREVQSQNR